MRHSAARNSLRRQATLFMVLVIADGRHRPGAAKEDGPMRHHGARPRQHGGGRRGWWHPCRAAAV